MGKKRNRRKKKHASNTISVNDFWPSSKEPSSEEQNDNSFIASSSFTGLRKGYVFQNGPKGMGYYSDTKSEEPKPPSPPQPEPPQLTEEETKQQQQINMKIRILINKYGIGEKNLQKAHGLWEKAIQIPQCKDVPNPYQWILGHEHFIKYWESLKSQANSYKPPSKDAPRPEQVTLILNHDSPLRKYMEYMYVYFVD